MVNKVKQVENLQLKMGSIINKIREVERAIKTTKGFKKYAKTPHKLFTATIKLGKAKLEVQNAMRDLMDAGESE